jgi:hypothetical protein
MAERRRFDNDDERAEPREQRGTSPIIWFTAAGVGLLALIVAVAGFSWFAMRADAVDRERALHAEAESRAEGAAVQAVPAQPAPISREDFRAKVMGKTAEKVIQAVGRPDESVEYPGKLGRKTWTYRNRTTSADRVDKMTDVNFHDDTVESVTYR